MGVDYTGHYGIGVEVDTKDEEDDIYDLMDDKLNEAYEWFSVGEGNYTGEKNQIFVVIKDPFEDGFAELEAKKDKLLAHIEDIELEAIGEFGAVGGLEVW